MSRSASHAVYDKYNFYLNFKDAALFKKIGVRVFLFQKYTTGVFLQENCIDCASVIVLNPNWNTHCNVL